MNKNGFLNGMLSILFLIIAMLAFEAIFFNPGSSFFNYLIAPMCFIIFVILGSLVGVF